MHILYIDKGPEAVGGGGKRGESALQSSSVAEQGSRVRSREKDCRSGRERRQWAVRV